MQEGPGGKDNRQYGDPFEDAARAIESGSRATIEEWLRYFEQEEGFCVTPESKAPMTKILASLRDALKNIEKEDFHTTIQKLLAGLNPETEVKILPN